MLRPSKNWTGIDNQKVLDQEFEAVRTFYPMTEEEIGTIVAKTQRVAADGNPIRT